MIEDIVFHSGVTLGYFLYAAVLYVESGLLVGMVLPGDSFLFTAGIIASQGTGFKYLVLLAIGILASIAGDLTGYRFGKKFGPKLFKEKKNQRFLHAENLKKAEEYYAKYGAATIIVARFTPIIRPIVPIMAGASSMKFSSFMAYNITGAVLWVTSLLSLGYFLGNTVPNIELYILPILAVIIGVSLLPALFGAFKAWKSHKATQ